MAVSAAILAHAPAAFLSLKSPLNRNRPRDKNRTKSAEKPPFQAVFLRKMVRVGRLELPASCSQSKRATNCATPGYEIFQLWSNMGSAPVFDQFPARGKTPSVLASQSFPGFWRSVARTPASRSQTGRVLPGEVSPALCRLTEVSCSILPVSRAKSSLFLRLSLPLWKKPAGGGCLRPVRYRVIS